MGGFLVLGGGCLAARLCRQPVRRLRLIELTLLGCLVVPWLGLVPGLPQWSLGWMAVPDAEDNLTAQPDEVPAHVEDRDMRERILLAQTDKQTDQVPPEAVPESVPPQQPLSTSPEQPRQASISVWFALPLPLVFAYAGLATGFLVWWLAGLMKLVRLHRSTYPAPALAADLFRAIAGPAGERVRLLASNRLDLPLTYNGRRPVIVLPGCLCDGDDMAALRYCLAHEWSHVERGDIWTWHLTSLVQLLFFYQPLFWWLRRQLRLCQDFLADARAAEQAAMAEDYADYLVGLARRRLAAPGLALGMADRCSNLYRRIIMLLHNHQPLEQRCRWLWTLAGALGIISLLAVVGAIRLDSVRAEDKKEPDKKQAPKDTPKGEPIHYTGKVFDKLSKKPIPGATVTVRRTTYGDPKGEKTIEESKHQTDAEGKYRFVIPPDQASERYLYIELDVEAPGYAPRGHFGYSFAMIQKNEKMGGRPFFENVDLRAAKEITGMVQTLDGKPAAGIKVLAYSNADKQDGFEYGSFANAKTDAKGVFRIWLVTPGPAVFWLLPEKYAPSTHVIKDPNKRGDLGTFALQSGPIIKGTVLDAKGKPVAGVYVHASKRGGIEDFNQPVADAIGRTALSNDKGEFQMAPLPPGTYEVMPQEHGYDPSSDDSRRQKRPVPGVFLRQKLTLKANEEPEAIDVRAVPHVVIEAQYLDSKGKPTRGHSGHMFGKMNKNDFWFGETKVDAEGKMVGLVPHGLTEARLSLMTNEHGVLRYRLTAGGQLSGSRDINLGTLNDDVKGIQIIRYVAPILVADARDKDGKQIKGFKVQASYTGEGGRKKPGEMFVNGVQGDVYFEHQEDGRWRSSQLLPDEEITVTLSADGYKPYTEKMNLAEGTTKDFKAVLEKK